MYWVGHRDLFALIRRTGRGLVWLNILFLLPLCLLPFGAGLLGRYDQEPVALRIYGLLLVVIAVMRVVIWLYATAMIPAVVAVGSDPVRHRRDAWLWTCRPAVATVLVPRAVVARA